MKSIDKAAEKEESTARMFLKEEEDVVMEEAEKDLKSFLSNCSQLKSLFKSVLDQKKRGEKVSGMSAARYFIGMKQLNRNAQFRLKKVREETQEKKLVIDQQHLKLQNLMYEIAHLDNEIKKCLEFKSRHEDVKLVPVEDFYTDAPEDISKPDATKTDQHQQTMARLYWELEQRKSLSGKAQETKVSVESLGQEIKSKHRYLASLAPKVKEIIQATRPVQDAMHLDFYKEEEEFEMAMLLPGPLYILFSQVKTYAQIADHSIKVGIEGDAEVARSVIASQPDDDEGLGLASALDQGDNSMGPAAGPPQGQGETAATGVEEEGASASSRDQKGSDEDEEEGSGKRKRKKHHRKSKLQENDIVNKLLTIHPLTVLLNLKLQNGTVLNLRFSYLINLKVVAVKMGVTLPANVISRSVSGSDLLTSSNLLDHLYSGDSGQASGSTLYTLRHYLSRRAPGAADSLWNQNGPAGKVGLPYLWAQRLAGLRHMPSSSPNSPVSASASGPAAGAGMLGASADVAFEHVEGCMTRLRRRLERRLLLVQQLDILERRGLDVSLSPAQAQLLPARTETEAIGWRRVSFDDFKAVARAQHFLDEELVHDYDMYFTVQVKKSQHCAQLWVAVPVDYPESGAIFLVQFDPSLTSAGQINILHVQDLESEVNCYWQEFSDKPAASGSNCEDEAISNLLHCQLLRCVACLDVLWRYESNGADQQARGADRGGGASRLVMRSSKYPSRSLPYKYVHNLDTFVQR